ncbi:flagellar type III secretion system protein FlhB [Paracoccus ravus]|uniref:flagellar type III secretion system protein FlhB n=1 Tax=Paracoccus ravus TaxID=2447760 RepID=UPI00106ED241|nr:flagellar type III secretion system protein FlhB [Paracoccus ravus]
MSNESDDKQFEPSPQKLRRAREEGHIPRSTELTAALTFLGLWGAYALSSAAMIPRWQAMAARALGGEPMPETGRDWIFDIAHGLGIHASAMVLLFVGLTALPVIFGLIVQRSVVFIPKKLFPDGGRINPLRNAKQKFGKEGLISFTISLIKASTVIAGGVFLYRWLAWWIITSDRAIGAQWIDGMNFVTLWMIYLALCTGVVFAGIDVLWKRFAYMRQQMMSRQELLDENKENEGDPQFKAVRRQKSVDIVLSSMLANVAKADVVIVNPTHYAIALEWKRGSGRAPVCLAKGVDEIAARIREQATEHRVPIWSDPTCARALHASVAIGEEIQAEHFAPVAAAIRFAESIRRKVRDGWAVAPNVSVT